MNYLRKATNNRSTIVASLMATAAAIGIAGAASTISIDFLGNAATGINNPATVVGATGYEASNWVTVSGGSGTPSSSLDLGGTTADITWTSSTTFFDGSATGSSGAEKLLSGYINNNTAGSINITVSQIPYAQYTVVVYHSSNSAGGVWSPVTLTPLGESAQTLTLAGPKFTWADNNDLDDRILVFENITESEFSISVPTGTATARGGIAGIQIVQIPEPSAALLGGLGMLALLRRRR